MHWIWWTPHSRETWPSVLKSNYLNGTKTESLVFLHFKCPSLICLFTERYCLEPPESQALDLTWSLQQKSRHPWRLPSWDLPPWSPSPLLKDQRSEHDEGISEWQSPVHSTCFLRVTTVFSGRRESRMASNHSKYKLGFFGLWMGRK